VSTRHRCWRFVGGCANDDPTRTIHPTRTIRLIHLDSGRPARSVPTRTTPPPRPTPVGWQPSGYRPAVSRRAGPFAQSDPYVDPYADPAYPVDFPGLAGIESPAGRRPPIPPDQRRRSTTARRATLVRDAARGRGSGHPGRDQCGLDSSTGLLRRCPGHRRPRAHDRVIVRPRTGSDRARQSCWPSGWAATSISSAFNGGDGDDPSRRPLPSCPATSTGASDRSPGGTWRKLDFAKQDRTINLHLSVGQIEGRAATKRRRPGQRPGSASGT